MEEIKKERERCRDKLHINVIIIMVGIYLWVIFKPDEKGMIESC